MTSDNGNKVEQVTPYGVGAKTEQVRQMFDSIAPAYDFMNRAMTMGIDIWWRRLAVKRLKRLKPQHILDEAQNTTAPQIKMFLTRLGMGSKMIVTGDTTQIDLPRSVTSGLIHALRVLDGVKGIGKVEFEKKDIVRHHLVQRIVEAYERFQEENKLYNAERREGRDDYQLQDNQQ